MIDIFVQVVNMSITASVVALCLALVRLAMGNRLPAGYCYLLWGVVFFRMLVPVSLPSAVSLFNMLLKNPGEVVGGYMVAMEYVEGTGGYIPVAQGGHTAYLIFTTIWITIALLFLVYQVFAYVTAARRLRTAFPVRVSQLLEACKEQTGVKRRVRVVLSPVFDTPVVMGILRPKIILPDFMDTANETIMRHILTHELVHIRRGDHMSKLLMTLALALHWFNPVAWLCYFWFGRDIETSCDEKVLGILGEGEKAGYAASLLELCSVQHSSLKSVTLSFGETAVRTRVTSALRYRTLSPVRATLFTLLVLVVGLVTTTNPVATYVGFQPVQRPVMSVVQAQFEQAAFDLSQRMAQGDTVGLLEMSRYPDAFYQPLYAALAEQPPQVDAYKLYPQSDQLAFCYLRCPNGVEYTARLEREQDVVKLSALHPAAVFEAAMGVEECEPVRFVRNLHRFGIVGGESSLPAPAVAGLCIDEEYRDRVKRGEISSDTVYLPSQWIAAAAERYFGLRDFSYTFDEALYDADRDCYIYSPNRGEPAEAEILSCQEQNGIYTIVAEVYADPLHLFPKGVMTYTLQKK